MAPFNDIVATRRDVDSPLEEQLFTDYYDRDEGLRQAPFWAPLAEVTTSSTTFVTVASWKGYVPIWATKLVVAIQVKVNGVTGSYQAIIGALTSDTKTTTSLTYVDTERLTFSDVSTVQGTEVTISLQAKISNGANIAYAKQTDGPACRFLGPT
jgi:hypothetical protein